MITISHRRTSDANPSPSLNPQGTDDDIDAVLASFKLADAAVAAVRIEEDCPPPSARVCGSFTPLPLRVVLLTLNLL